MRLAIVAPIVLLLAAASEAHAETLELKDAVTDFHMTLDAGDAVLCRVKPAPATPSDVCTAVAAKMDLKALKPAFGVAAFVRDDWTLAVVAMRTASLSPHRPTDDQMSLFATGVRSYLVSSGSAPGISGREEGSKYDVLEIAGARALRYDASIEKPALAVQETVSIFAAGGVVSVSFVAPRNHVDDVHALMDASVEGIRVRLPPVAGPPLNTAPRPAPAPKTAAKAKVMAFVIGFGAMAILVGAIAFALGRRQRS